MKTVITALVKIKSGVNISYLKQMYSLRKRELFNIFFLSKGFLYLYTNYKVNLIFYYPMFMILFRPKGLDKTKVYKNVFLCDLKNHTLYFDL